QRWGFVFAIVHTWKTVEGKALKDPVIHVPRKYYQRTRVPHLPGTTGCKTFWIFSKRLGLRHIGDATAVLSKKRCMFSRTIRNSWCPIWTNGRRDRWCTHINADGPWVCPAKVLSPSRCQSDRGP